MTISQDHYGDPDIGFIYNVEPQSMSNRSMIPIRLIIDTFEIVDDQEFFTLGHLFPGYTDEEAIEIMQAHCETDVFLDASLSNQVSEDTYEGELEYKGELLRLRSIIRWLEENIPEVKMSDAD